MFRINPISLSYGWTVIKLRSILQVLWIFCILQLFITPLYSLQTFSFKQNTVFQSTLSPSPFPLSTHQDFFPPVSAPKAVFSVPSRLNKCFDYHMQRRTPDWNSDVLYDGNKIFCFLNSKGSPALCESQKELLRYIWKMTDV